MCLSCIVESVYLGVTLGDSLDEIDPDDLTSEEWNDLLYKNRGMTVNFAMKSSDGIERGDILLTHHNDPSLVIPWEYFLDEFDERINLLRETMQAMDINAFAMMVVSFEKAGFLVGQERLEVWLDDKLQTIICDAYLGEGI